MQYKVFGCKVNKYYTDRWLNSEYLANKTGTFVASCVVTDSAKRKWIRFVKKEIANISWTQKIYISGCWAFKDGKAQNDFFEIYPDLAFAKEKIEVLDEEPMNSKSMSFSGLTRESNKETRLSDQVGQWQKKGKIDLSKLKQAQKKQIYTKKFILIQGWCDSFCTFCLTVQKRGRHYYRSAEDIIEEIQEFEMQWGKEVVLTGVNLSAWWLDNTHDIKNFSPDMEKNWERWEGSRFAELLREILDNTSIPRIRISSLWPEFVDDQVLEILTQERIYPHFHFSIQSGSSNTLKSMARHYDGNYMRKLLHKTLNIPRKDEVSVSIWADIIVWFPWETEEDFLDTYNLVKDFKITKVHAFPFSAHTMWESVPAGKFKDQIPEDIKKERMQELMKLWDEIREDFRKSQKWKTFKVLVEKSSLTSFWGKAEKSSEIQKINTHDIDSSVVPPSEWRRWSGWTENYLEADQHNFEIIAGVPERNSIIVGKFF